MSNAFKKLTAFSVLLSMLLSGSAFTCAADSDTLFWEGFDQYATNEVPPDYNLPQTGYTRIEANAGKTDKSLMVKSESDDFTLAVNYFNGKTEQERTAITSVTAQFDARVRGVCPDVNIGFRDAAAGTDVFLAYLDENGNLYQTDNNKLLGKVGGQLDSAIALGYDLSLGTYSIYLEGKGVVYNWKLKQKLTRPEAFIVKVENPGEEGSAFYMDDVFVCEGDALAAKRPHSFYNPNEVAVYEVKDEVGSQHFIDNDFEDDNNPQSGISWLDAKTNSIERVYDEAENNHYMHMVKLNPIDSFFDVKMEAGAKYLVAQMDAKVTKPGAKNCLFMVRDNTTVTGTQMDEYPVLITGNMQLTCAGKTLAQLKTDTWYTVAAVFNVKKKSVDVYLDGELVGENITYTSQPVKVVNQVRVTQTADGGLGDLCVDNYKIYEGKEISDNTEYVSIFSDGSNERELLKGSIAIHGYAGTGYKNDEKFELGTQPVVDDKDNDRVYVALADLNNLFDKQLTRNGSTVYDGANALGIKTIEENGTLFADYKGYAESQGKYVLDDGNGMQIAVDMKIEFPEETVRNLNNYLFFRRVSAQELQEMFVEKNGEGEVHPRLYATAADFENIKVKMENDEVMTYWHNSFIRSADTLVTDGKPVVYYLPDGIRLLDTCRVVLERMEHLGYAYQMTKEQKYADRAWMEMNAVFYDFKDWNVGHMLDPAEMLEAIAIGYDWMYDAFTEEQRTVIVEKMIDMGLRHVRDAYYGRLTITGGTGRSDAFVKWNSNFNTVINGGAIAAALAIADREPEFCFDVLEKAQRSLEYVMYMIAPDGGWEESVNYWGYNFMYFMRMVGAMDSALGDDLGLMKYKGLDKTTMFAISQESPIAMNAFHDAVSYPIEATPLSWFAVKMNNANDMRFRKYTAENMGRGGRVFDMIYYDPKMAEGEIDMPLDWYVRGIEAISSKYSVTDRDGLFFASHGGPTVCYHSHPDVGAFVFDLMGERWSEDLGMDTYTPTAPGEYYYRKRTEGHSTIVINPDETMGQAEGNSEIIRFETKPKGSVFVMDMTEPYAPHSANTLRGFKVDDDRRSLTIRDEIDLTKDNSTVYWFMQTKATEAEEIEDGLILKKNGKTLRLQFQASVPDATIEFGKALALPTSPNMEEDVEKNKEYNRVSIKLAGSGHVTLTVKLSAFDDYNTEVDQRPISEWTITDGELAARDRIQLDMIQLDGKDLFSFDKNQSAFNVFRNEGDPFPVVTATAAGKPVEIEQASEESPSAMITVYNSESRDYRNRFAVNFVTVKSLDALKDYHRAVVQNLTVGSEPEAVNIGTNMLDGDLETRWTTFTLEDEAVFDLGESLQIDAFAAAFWKGNERVYEFAVAVSEDGINYANVFDGASNGTTAGVEVFDGVSFNARYVKLIAKGNSVNQNTNVVEFALLQHK